jgi:hypothetical protein
MNTYDYKDALSRIDPKLKDFRDMKEMYIHSNNHNAGHLIGARRELVNNPGVMVSLKAE